MGKKVSIHPGTLTDLSKLAKEMGWAVKKTGEKTFTVVKKLGNRKIFTGTIK